MTDRFEPWPPVSGPPHVLTPVRKRSMLAPLRNRNYALLFWGQWISLLGDQAYGLALPWTVLAMAATMFITMHQQRIAPEHLARALSIQFLAGGISQPLSRLGAGALAATLGPGVVFVVGAAALVVPGPMLYSR